jgi:predicted RNase H-like nuclease (RuvC/YqgF family)
MHIDNFALRLLSVIITFVFLANSPVHAQDSLQNTVEALQRETSEIKALLEEMKVEITRSRAEAAALRRELELTRGQLAGTAAPQEESPVEKLNEELQLVQAKVDEQYQTKVESASKYRVRLSGIVLMNLLSSRGAVDNWTFRRLL